MYLSRTTSTIIKIIVIFILLSKYYTLEDGINDDPPPASPTHSKTNWIKSLFARLFLPNLDFRLKSNEEPRIIPDDKIIDKGGGEKVKEAVTMTLSKGKTTLEETAKSAAEITKDKIHQTAINLKDTIFSPHDHHHDDEPTHEL
ncbi:hypothetical protein CTI12_AA252940 [Artemisia annua]|uniref:Uncharacterized protein n=1 Tax=Artemisia annua TaxID=35608 RepID=A0A2U1NLI2_ARTAN|nr:hypothetical protein CTI12_AA252940 [Artemisia annua]